MDMTDQVVLALYICAYDSRHVYNLTVALSVETCTGFLLVLIGDIIQARKTAQWVNMPAANIRAQPSDYIFELW